MEPREYVDRANILFKLAGLDNFYAMYRPFGSTNSSKVIRKYKSVYNYKKEWADMAAYLNAAAEIRKQNEFISKKPFWLCHGRPRFIANGIKYYTSFEELEKMKTWEEKINVTDDDLIFGDTRCFGSPENFLEAVIQIVNRQIAS